MVRCRGRGAGAEVVRCRGRGDSDVVKRGLCLGSAELQVQRCRGGAEVQRCRGPEVQVQQPWCLGGAEVVQRWYCGDAVVLLRWCSKGSAEVVCRGAELLIWSRC